MAIARAAVVGKYGLPARFSDALDRIIELALVVFEYCHATGAIGRVLEHARGLLPIAADVEVTLEANPGTIERGRFAEYAAAGVNRVSVGAQTFDASRLRALGRVHSPAETASALAELHAAGVDNFNIDLMYGLPGQGVAEALADVQAALSFSPAQISHYHLTLEPGTPFAAQPPPALPDEDTTVEILAACLPALQAAGFERYEVSAYARSGRACAHNLLYWNFGDYLGLGAGAHGKLSGRDPASGEWRIVRTTQPCDYQWVNIIRQVDICSHRDKAGRLGCR